MSYDLELHRQAEAQHCERLLREGGAAGWGDYVRHKARALAKDDPVLHGDLPAKVQAVLDELLPAPKRGGRP